MSRSILCCSPFPTFHPYSIHLDARVNLLDKPETSTVTYEACDKEEHDTDYEAITEVKDRRDKGAVSKVLGIVENAVEEEINGRETWREYGTPPPVQCESRFRSVPS